MNIFYRGAGFIVAFLVLSPSAYAYLDPGAGSIIIQALIASTLAGLYTLKIYWARFKYFLLNLFQSNRHDPDSSETNQDSVEQNENKQDE